MSELNVEGKRRGDTRQHVFVVSDGKNPVDVSLWTNIILTLDENIFPEDTITQVEQYAGSVFDGPNGKIAIVPTGDVAPGTYFYDAQALDSNTQKVTFAYGTYEIVQDITKD